MKRKRHTEEQIIAILKEHEAGMKTADLCRKHGISEASFYNWKAKYGGLEVSEAKRLKGLESENAKLKKLLADAMLDNAALKELLAKKGDARCQARDCRSCTFGVRVERAAGVQDDQLCADDGAVSLAPAGRQRIAGAAEGSCPCATALRLSAVACPAATGGLHREPQAAISDLSRGTPHGPPARRA
jgi:putative transposase